jgi:predicted TIM-barrel fold metal-dependent hydrolase
VLKVIDSHHHIWRKADLPWLLEGQPRIFGDYTALKRDYPIEEFEADTAPVNVVKSVYLQANWAYDRSVEEARWVDETGKRHGMPNAVVANADLRRLDVERLLDDYTKIPSVKGIRQHLHWHNNPKFSYIDSPDVYDHEDWRRGFRYLADRGFSFDLQLFPSQLKGATDLLDSFPKVTFILNHAGMLDARDAASIEVWRSGMETLAKCPNLVVKFTGLGTFDHKSSPDIMAPMIPDSLRLFGAKRCMYGSNFPIEKLWTTYATYFDNVVKAVGDVSDADRHEIFYGTASRAYRLD